MQSDLGVTLVLLLALVSIAYVRSGSRLFAMIALEVLAVGFIVPWSTPRSLHFAQIAEVLLISAVGWSIVWTRTTDDRVRSTLEARLETAALQGSRIRELEQINRQMTDYTMDVQNRAVIDQLTGLYNQTHFHHRLLIEVEKARQTGGALSLVLCDIDNFKTFNDRFGHYLGDDVLRATANAIWDAVQDECFVPCRLGGEELVIAMPDVALPEALAFAQRLRQAIADTMVPGPEGPLRVTISAGVATFPDHAGDAQGLTKLADQAMYAAKDLGRNKVCSAADLQRDQERARRSGQSNTRVGVTITSTRSS